MAYGFGSQRSRWLAACQSDQKKLEILDITAKAIGGMGEKEMEILASLPHASFDLVIMSPPFVRPTGHEGKKIGVPVPMFAAFSSSDEEQYMMSKAIAAHGAFELCCRRCKYPAYSQKTLRPDLPKGKK